MPVRRLFRYASAIAILLPGTHVAYCQTYPDKPIRILSSAPGGSADFAARQIANGLTASLRQQIIVDNRGGAGGLIAIEIVNKATPDGYTLLLYSSNIWTLPFLQKVSYDPLKDFAPITLAVRSPNILVVNPLLPVQSVRELIAFAKARPKDLNYGASGSGSSPHLAAELFKAMAGVSMTLIMYKGGAQALTDLIGGQVQVMFATAASVSPLPRTDKLKALAVTSAEPSALFPGLPTVAGSGLSGYESASMAGVFAPAKTDPVITRRLNQEIRRILHSAEVREKFLSAGVEAVGSTSEELTAIMKSEMARLGKVIKDAGIRAE